MWYSDSKPEPELDYSKPIIAVTDSGYTHLLLPNDEGYDWFNVILGEWNSHRTWPTAQDAVAAYKNAHRVFNAVITITEDK